MFKRWEKTKKKGFTIVELIIVVVVLGVLAAITIVGYTSVKTEAQVSGLANSLGELEDRMRLWAGRTGTTWQIDPVGGGGTPISTMIQNDPQFRLYVDAVPEVPGVQSQAWFYDNEGDTKTECSGTYSGVNIVLRYVSDNRIATALDERIDDGNLSCGKVRYADNRIFYVLSYTQKITD